MFEMLEGIKVIDLTTVALGPYATQTLGDFGAEVIKVESKDGDILRSARPGRREDIGVAFLNFNRNKRSIVLDLKQPGAQAILHKLIESADVFVHNMRARSAAALGASPEILHGINPGLVYCYSPGFGARGPDADAPAYDDVIQARSGLASLNADSEGAPHFIRTIACDKIVGLHLALAVLGGLVQQSKTGKGVVIEAPMLETMATFLLAEHLAGETLVPAEGPMGYNRVMSVNRRPYQTTDGYLAILPYSTRHWVRLFTACGLDDWATKDIVVDAPRRSENIDVLYAKLAEMVRQRSTAAWEQLLVEQDIPHARVSRLEDLLTDEHLRAAGLLHQVSDERVGPINELRSPFEVDGRLSHEAKPNRIAPGLGEHTVEILREAGYATREIDEFLRAGIAA